MVDPKADVIRRAIWQGHAVTAVYHGHAITLYPHALGWRNGKHGVVALVRRAGTAGPRRAASPWDWLPLRDLRSLALQPGRWHTAAHPPTELLDLVEAVVERSLPPPDS